MGYLDQLLQQAAIDTPAPAMAGIDPIGLLNRLLLTGPKRHTGAGGGGAGGGWGEPETASAPVDTRPEWMRDVPMAGQTPSAGDWGATPDIYKSGRPTEVAALPAPIDVADRPVATGDVPQTRVPLAMSPAGGEVDSTDMSASRGNFSGNRGGIAPTQQPAGPTPASPYERLTQTLADNRGTLMALASGFAGARNIGEGMSRAFERAAPVMVAEQKTNVANQAQRATYQALIAKGVPPADALAAAMNPDVMKTVAAKYFETKPRVPHSLGKDMFGNDVMGMFDPNTAKFYTLSGEEIGSKEMGGGPVMNGFAKGVNSQNFDNTKKGDEYLAQYSPEIQAAVKDYIAGKSIPTGNARQGYANVVKQAAQKYGADTGIEVSDDLFNQRRAYRQELGKNSANAAGGQAKAFTQSIEHLEHMVEAFKKQGNKDVLGVPKLSHLTNDARAALSTEQAGKVRDTEAIGQILAGEVGKLFSGSQGGGVAERQHTMDRFKGNLSPQEFAGAVNGTLSTLEGGLKALNDRRDAILGPNSDVNFLPDSTKKRIAKVLDDIDEMRGLPRGTTAKSHAMTSGDGYAAAPAQGSKPAAGSAPKPGRYMFDPATNSMKLVQ